MTSAEDPGHARSVLVDAHVHFHPCFRLASFLEGARRNFAAAARTCDLAPDTPRYLLFCEVSGADYFGSIRRGENSLPPGWEKGKTPEADSVLLVDPDGATVVLSAGRQVRTREGLEVLLLMTLRRFPDGVPVRQLLEAAAGEGIAVVPWGFGKWWFRRGQLVRELMEEPPVEPLLLGDNSNRPTAGRLLENKLFNEGRYVVLPGSDPLPLPGHESHAGRYGFVADIDWSSEKPAAVLRDGIRRNATDIRPYGVRSGIFSFASDQVRLRLGRR